MSRARDLSKLGNPNIIVADTERVGFGTQVPENPANASSSLISAGIVTATAFFGDGSNLEGVASAGLGTAVDDTKDSIGQNIFFTNAELSINANTTVNAPDSSNIAYTQYQQVTVESGSELIIADGDSFIPDVLGIGTALQASTAGAGNGLFGTLFVDNIENVAGRGGPNFPLGMTVSGVSTFSGSATFSGNVSIGGTLTYEDVTNVDSIGVVTARNGIDITGASAGVNGSSNLILKVGGSEKLRVTGSGIGIGTISPTSELHVMQSKSGGESHGSSQITLERDGTNYLQFLTANNGTSGILFGDVADNDGTKIKYDHNLSMMLFETETAERLRIGSSGQIGIAGANYGTSGQVLTSQGASAAPQWATPSGGLSVADIWGHSQVGFSLGDSWLGGGNWTKILSATSNVTTVTSATEGVFTMPSTGVYRVEFSGRHNSGQCRFKVENTANNGGSWSNLIYSDPLTHTTQNHFVDYFNCTNTSNDKLRFAIVSSSGSGTMESIHAIFQKLN